MRNIFNLLTHKDLRDLVKSDNALIDSYEHTVDAYKEYIENMKCTILAYKIVAQAYNKLYGKLTSSVQEVIKTTNDADTRSKLQAVLKELGYEEESK